MIKLNILRTIPKYFLWLKYLSWFNYANELLTVNQWNGVKNISCDSDVSLCFVEGENIIDYLNINIVRYFNYLITIMII